jgi:aspartyl-tRNA synthetase
MNLEHIEQLLKEAKQKKQPRDDQGKFKEVDVFELAEKFGLDKKDLRVAELALKEFKTPQEKKAAVFQLGYKMQRVPTEADKAGVLSERISFASHQEQLQQEYLSGSRSLSGNQLIKFKMAMRAKGLDIS